MQVTAKVAPPAPPPPIVEYVDIRLEANEAKMLMALVGSIGGGGNSASDLTVSSSVYERFGFKSNEIRNKLTTPLWSKLSSTFEAS